MTEAEKYFLSHKKEYFWSVLSTGCGTHLNSRMVLLQHSEKAGFFIFTKNNTRKVGQIEQNGHVTLSLYPEGDYNNVVAHCSARVSAKKEDIAEVWTDQMLQYGYTGKDDERARIVFFTIHSVVHGNKVFAGVPQDPHTFDIDRKAPLKPLPSGPFKNEEAMAAVRAAMEVDKNAYLITWNALHQESRMMETIYSTEFGLAHVTGANTKKVKEIDANPNVNLLFVNKKDMIQVVVDAVCWVDRTLETKKKMWNDSLKTYGYAGPEDPKWVILRYALRSVEKHVISTNVPEVLVCEPPAYDRDTQIMYRASLTGKPCFLTTVDKAGVPHSRMMGRISFHPTLGFWMGSRFCGKAEQISQNPHATVTLYDDKTTDEYCFEVFCTMMQSPMFNYATWEDFMTSVGYTGPDDKNIWKITVNPTKAQLVNVNEFWAQANASVKK
ncbi:uncharacterized protein MONOS_914 [Monocercomonoides exilis]|uniref:uncharacterized protein n=1 Tax=Monocercomonoides exilis TaxID=2049356 RepID=UPI00355A0788|nr:hypothetical protein MONOS_914 [Monocercomonoides exilis]|eukprot:MONOS_914.1-p1 / transcript=MONOS_914.1 / gene=MONOS_914 / organism=Monocercomonoides_exilis_PA203 / gene_product=unspecified product / transcript_product=unspecified product / location=Mono_scaffold00015:110866-112182(+) / protein_length=438 / sequence_SO=supercontig / SO=protein_coding / is_pseudo=false